MKFDEWFHEIDVTQRSERFWDDVYAIFGFIPKNPESTRLLVKWLEAAYNRGLSEALDKQPTTIPTIPIELDRYWPNLPPTWQPHCSKCGINLAGVMGYVCSDNNCPTFKRTWADGLTASVDAQSYNISNSYASYIYST